MESSKHCWVREIHAQVFIVSCSWDDDEWYFHPSAGTEKNEDLHMQTVEEQRSYSSQSSGQANFVYVGPGDEDTRFFLACASSKWCTRNMILLVACAKVCCENKVPTCDVTALHEDFYKLMQ